MSEPTHGNITHWTRTVEAQMVAQRARLRTRDPAQIAERCGAQWDAATHALTLRFLQQSYVVYWPDYCVMTAQEGPPDTMTQALITTYLVRTDGTPRAGEWIAFRELPGGLFYHQAFTGYTGGALVRALGADRAAFERGAQAVGGSALTGVGDAAFEFQVLPHLWLAVVYWLGDPEDGFPPQANVLFDRTAPSTMILDGLAIIGNMLVRRIIRGAQSEKN